MEESQSPTTPAGPRVSAIVLSYNDRDGLRRALAAIEASTARPEMEIIVIDNGSFDGSGTIDSDFPGATFLRLPRNFGATKALNIAMRTAVGEYYFFLTPEMEVAADAVKTLAARLDRDADVAAVCPLVSDSSGSVAGDYWRLPDADTLKRAWREPGSLPRIAPPGGDQPAVIEYAGRSALMVRKFFLRGLNYFDERFGEFGADLDLAFQIRRAGRKTLLDPAARVTRHTGPGMPAEAATILKADQANGVAVFLGKHYGMFAGLGFRVGAALGDVARLQLPRALALASGTKIDGSQQVP